MRSRVLAVVCLLFLSCGTWAQTTTYSLTPDGKQSFTTQSGTPLAGGKVYTYAAGTTTLLSTFANSSGTPNPDPVILDTSGRATIYLQAGVAYKFVVTDVNGVQQWTQDNISLSAAVLDLSSPPPIGSTTPNTGAFTILNGVCNAAAAPGADIGAKINSCAALCASPLAGCKIEVPAGTYTYTTAVIVPQNTTIDCDNTSGWSAVQEPSPTAANLSYTGTGDAVTLSGVQAQFRGCALTVGTGATSGIKMTAGNTLVDHAYLIGGGTSTKLVNINCGAPGCEKPEVDFTDFYGYTGKAIYCVNANDATFTNVTGYATAAQSTSVAFTVDSQCNGLKVIRGSFGGSGLHQLVLSDTLGTGAPTWTVFDLMEADCSQGGAGILFDSTLGSQIIHARLTSSWAAGAGQICVPGTSPPVTISAGIEIDGGDSITIDTSEIRSNTGDGILINGAGAGNITLTNNRIWTNNFKYRSLGGDNGDYNGIRLSAFNGNLIVQNNIIGNYGNGGTFADGHQHYGFKSSVANNLSTVIVTGNSFGQDLFEANTLGSYTYISAPTYLSPIINNNVTPNIEPVPQQTLYGTMSVFGAQSLTGPSLIPGFGATNAFLQGLGMNLVFNGTNWVTKTNTINNGAVAWLGTEQGNICMYNIPTSSPTTGQTISQATLVSTYNNLCVAAAGDVAVNHGSLAVNGGLSTGGATAIDSAHNFFAGNGSNVVYRCATAGALPVGALTITAASCGTTADSGLRVK